MGRVARFEVAIGDEQGDGLVALYKEKAGFDVVVIDSSGRARPDWAARFRERPLGARVLADAGPSTTLGTGGDWRTVVRRLGSELDPARRPHALAAIVVRPVR